MNKGDRVKLSAEGLRIAIRPRTPAETWRGTIKGMGHRGNIVVIWDGRKTPLTYCRDFIEKVSQ